MALGCAPAPLCNTYNLVTVPMKNAPPYGLPDGRELTQLPMGGCPANGREITDMPRSARWGSTAYRWHDGVIGACSVLSSMARRCRIKASP